MVILHNAIKTIQNVFLCFLKKRTQTCFFSKNPRNPDLKKAEGWFKKNVFFNPDYLSILFCDFLLIARSGTNHVTISLIGRRIPRVKDPGK